MIFVHVCSVFKYHILILLFCCLFQSFLLSLLALYAFLFIPVHAHGMHRCDLPGCRPLFCRCLRFPSGTGSVKLQASAADLAYEAWLFPGVLFFPRAHQPPAHVRRNGLCRPGTGHFYPRKTAGRADFFLFTFLNNDF